MYQKKKMMIYTLILLAGLGIIVLSVLFDDHSYWGGFGGGLVGVGVVRLLQGFRYRTDEDFAREVDTGNQDERNKFLMERAQAWTCTLTILALAAAGIILRFMGLYAYSTACACIICAMLVIYCVCYWIAAKKY